MRNAPTGRRAQHAVAVDATDRQQFDTTVTVDDMLRVQIARRARLVGIDSDRDVAEKVLGAVEAREDRDGFADGLNTMLMSAERAVVGNGVFGEARIEQLPVAGVERGCVADEQIRNLRAVGAHAGASTGTDFPQVKPPSMTNSAPVE